MALTPVDDPLLVAVLDDLQGRSCEGHYATAPPCQGFECCADPCRGADALRSLWQKRSGMLSLMPAPSLLPTAAAATMHPLQYLQYHADNLRRVALREVPLLQDEIKQLAAQAGLLQSGGQAGRALSCMQITGPQHNL